MTCAVKGGGDSPTRVSGRQGLIEKDVSTGFGEEGGPEIDGMAVEAVASMDDRSDHRGLADLEALLEA